MRAKDTYNSAEGGQKFLNFLDSTDGQTFQDILYDAFRAHLGSDTAQTILDAACGSGWLSARLMSEFSNIESCDGSEYFLDHIKKTHPELRAQNVDLAKPLPYTDEQFNTIIFSMAAHDVENQTETFSYLARTLKPGGKLLISIANPYYAAPVGNWKRGFLGRLLGQKPELKVQPYHLFAHKNRNYTFEQKIESYFYKLSEHINAALTAGLTLKKFEDLECPEDSPSYNMQYRMHRYPILLFMAFEKPRQ